MFIDWKDRIIVTLYKGKGPKSECSNYRPIILLSVPGKVFAHVILVRKQPLIDRTRRPQQSGFTRGRSTHLALRLLSEIQRDQFNRRLNMAYLDVKAAFVSVDRRALWKALCSRGIPDVLTDLIAAIHENTGAAIRVGKNKCARLETTSGGMILPVTLSIKAASLPQYFSVLH